MTDLTDQTLHPDESTDPEVLGGPDDATFQPAEVSLGAEDPAIQADGTVAPDDLRMRAAREHAGAPLPDPTGPGLVDDDDDSSITGNVDADTERAPEAAALHIDDGGR